MIVVTGAPRTGTSLMMQTLIHLGKKSPAPAFLPIHDNIKEYNKNGFFEFDEETVNGVQSSKYKGKAIKLFGGQFFLTPKKYMDKVIWCKRDDSEALESYKPIHKKMGEMLTPEMGYRLTKDLLNIINWEDMPFDLLEVDLNSFKDNPKKTIDKICSFLGEDIDKKKKERAVKNINN